MHTMVFQILVSINRVSTTNTFQVLVHYQKLNIFFCTDISSAPLEGHSGSIQAALNLEFPHKKVNSFEIAIEGINGQLPNLDLVNTVFRLCRKEHIPASLHTEVTNSVIKMW